MNESSGILLHEVALDETLLRALCNAEASIEDLEELNFDEEIALSKVDPYIRRQLRDSFDF